MAWVAIMSAYQREINGTKKKALSETILLKEQRCVKTLVKYLKRSTLHVRKVSKCSSEQPIIS